MIRIPTLLILAVLVCPVSKSQDADPAALDFWIGEWEVSWTGANGELQRGTNTISRILEGKVVLEEFDASQAIGFTGKSFSVLDQQSGAWKQTWVDSNGSYLDFNGIQEGDTFIFHRTYQNKEGELVESRMVFRDITTDTFTWDWQGRKDPNGDWKLLWQINYQRKS